MSPLDPLGPPGGLNRGQTPQNGKIEFLATFLEEIFLSFLGSLGTLILSPTIQKNWCLTLFWYIFGPKTAKKRARFHEAQQFWLWMNFLFYWKNQLFQTLFMTSFFFKLENRDSEVSQTKNFRVRHPLILPIEKRNLQEWSLNPRSFQQQVNVMRSTN